MAGRGPQANLSFFAFTATPKAKTLELFGILDPDSGRYVASHLYSMRQAIEEGFIHDVLASHTTYKMYWRIQKAVADDPAYAEVKARRAAAMVTPSGRRATTVPDRLVIGGASRLSQ